MTAMISRLEGTLDDVRDGVAEVRCGELTYSILVPGADQQRLSPRTGERIVFHTLHYLEGVGQGASYVPRLIGFTSPADRAFFEVFTTVKGMGNRKALRALQVPFGRVARAIAEKDVDLLKSLPEIGKRSAETIVAQLSGKVDRFLDEASVEGAGDAAVIADDARGIANEAAAVLTSLGEPKLQVMQLVERAIAADPTIDTPEELITAVYRLRDLPAG